MRYRAESLGLAGHVSTLLMDLIHERLGLHYAARESEQLADRLAPLVIDRGLDSFMDYYYRLKYSPEPGDWSKVMDALSVQETYFWREIDQLRSVVDRLVPALAAAQPGRPLQIWSSACATGEEPLTIAMLLSEAGWFDRASIHIVASDASPAALARARQGEYGERAFRNLPGALREKYFVRRENRWSVSPDLHRRVSLRPGQPRRRGPGQPIRIVAGDRLPQRLHLFLRSQHSAHAASVRAVDAITGVSVRRGVGIVAAPDVGIRSPGNRRGIRVRQGTVRSRESGDRGRRRESVMTTPLRVLVVDDSAYIRKVVKEMLSRSPDLEVVGTARDSEEALEQVERLRPDVVTCDLIMPGTDGVDFIQRQMSRRRVPIVIVSMAGESSERVLSGLDAGAIDFVQKPTALATERVFEVADELIAKVLAAAGAPMRHAPQARAERPAVANSIFQNRYSVLVVGVSTGGPQGLKSVIAPLPADFPIPVAVVLHMPIGYTEAYAKRLDELSALTVIEARDGEEVRPGLVMVAPAGRHLTFRRTEDGRVVTRLDVRPLDTAHRPSVDVLFQSAADVYSERVLGVVMTGMGADGRDGAAWIKARGGAVLTEAEETCVVYGMPRAIVEAGLSDEAVPLDRLTAAILERV